MLPHPQSRAFQARHRGICRLDHGRAARAVRRPCRRATPRVGCRLRPVQNQSASRVARERCVAVHPYAPSALQPAARPPVPEHRLRALHACGAAGREPPRRTLVVGAAGIEGVRPAPALPPCGAVNVNDRSDRMDYLPMFVRLEAQPVLVVGGGAVAARKARWLARGGAEVTVVAPRWSAALAARIEGGAYRGLREAFAPGQLRGMRLVVAASNDRATNEEVSRAARARQIPVNVVDSPELSTFIFPAIIERSPLLVAVSSAGAAPV